MGAMKTYAIADRVGEAKLFVNATKALARANGLAIAFQKGTGLLLRVDRSPHAEAGLKKAADTFARSVSRSSSAPSDELAVSAARQHDVTAWWTWDFRNDAPREMHHDDEYFAPQEVDHLGEDVGGDVWLISTKRTT